MDEVSSSGELRSGRAVAPPHLTAVGGAAWRGGKGGKTGHHGRPRGSPRNRTGFMAAQAVGDGGGHVRSELALALTHLCFHMLVLHYGRK